MVYYIGYGRFVISFNLKFKTEKTMKTFDLKENHESAKREYSFGKFESLGMYEKHWITKNGGVLCFECVTENLEQCSDFEAQNPNWFLIGCQINWEDNQLYCDHCNRKINEEYSND